MVIQRDYNTLERLTSTEGFTGLLETLYPGGKGYSAGRTVVVMENGFKGNNVTDYCPPKPMEEFINGYLLAEKKLYDYFGYTETLISYPVDMQLCVYWQLDSDRVYFADSENELMSLSNGFYSNKIITDTSLKSSIYIGKEYTMVIVSTLNEGNKYLQIFDNANRREHVSLPFKYKQKFACLIE